MKKSILMLMFFCLMSAPAMAKDGKMSRLDKKIAEIEQEYKEDVQEIESKHKLSAEMKQLRLEQEKQVKELKIKQAKEMYELKTQQKAERKALKQKEHSQTGEQTMQNETDNRSMNKKHKDGQKRKKSKKFSTDN